MAVTPLPAGVTVTGNGRPPARAGLRGLRHRRLELIVARHDIAQVAARPALDRLARIGGVAGQVAG